MPWWGDETVTLQRVLVHLTAETQRHVTPTLSASSSTARPASPSACPPCGIRTRTPPGHTSLTSEYAPTPEARRVSGLANRSETRQRRQQRRYQEVCAFIRSYEGADVELEGIHALRAFSLVGDEI